MLFTILPGQYSAWVLSTRGIFFGTFKEMCNMVKTNTLALTAKGNQPFWFVNHQDIIFQIMWLKCFKTQTRLYFKLKIWIPHQGLKVQPKTPRRLTNSLTFWTTQCRDLQLRAWLLLLYLPPLCNQWVEVWYMVYFFLKVVYRLLLHNLGLIQDKMQYLIKIWHICPAFLRLQPYDQSGNMAIWQFCKSNIKCKQSIAQLPCLRIRRRF